MKILIVTPFFPHSRVYHAGGKTIYELIKVLSKKHKIHLFSRIEPHEIKFVREMESFCESIKLLEFKTPRDGNPLKPFLITVSYLYLAFRANRIISSNGFDIVQVEHTETGLLIKKVDKVKMILDAHDVISKPAERVYLYSKGYILKSLHWVKWQIVKRMEIYIARKFNLIFTRSRMDRDILLGFDRNLKINILPHPIENVEHPSGIAVGEKIILYAGAMHRDVNVRAALFIYKEVLPLVREEIGDVKLYIVGNNPPQVLRELPAGSDNVLVRGFVESLTPYYRRAAVFVSPMFIGGGIIVKNIEAMSYGLPVITTAIGNEGIEAVPDRDILIAETPEEFARAILRILKNPEQGERIGLKGKEYVERHFSQELILGKVENIYGKLLKGSR